MVNAEFVGELPGRQEVIAVVTKDSVESLGLTEGREANVIIKATNVLLDVD